MTSPVIEWRNPTSPFGVVTGIPMVGTGFAGAIPLGTSSAVVILRIYNNFANAGSVGDATNCVLAVYDGATNQGVAANPSTTGLYIKVQVVDYDSNTTGGDTFYFGLGGQTKHAVPVNSAVLWGAASNYFTVNIQAVIPTNATQGSVQWGLWLEYSSTS